MRISNECVFVCLRFQLHMLGDGSRGAVIEMTLAKVLYMSSKRLNTAPTHECFQSSRTDQHVRRFFARDDSDHRNERHFGKHPGPAGVSEGGKLHQ